MATATLDEAALQALVANATPSNDVVLENQKQGTPESQWMLHGAGDASIQGFATDISVNQGGTIDFKIATDSTKYRIEIYRLGWYGGDGARLVDTVENEFATPLVQPHPIVDMTTGLIDCGNWAVSSSWDVPADATSGVYMAKLVREDGTAGENMIPFVVRNDTKNSDVTFQTSDTTWEAYNAWGGASLYWGEVPMDPNDMIAYMPPNCSCGLQAIGRAYKVSYNRPYITSTSPVGGAWDYIFGAEYPAIRWLEQNGYDVNYISGVDSARDGSQLLNSKIFLSVGHDEYWSGEQRANVEAARDAGVNLAFWSGNEVYWKTRWETSIDGSGTPYRTMVTYKETWAGTGIDPSDTSTGTWRDPRFQDAGQEPENSLTGQLFKVDGYAKDTITIGSDFANLRFWRNTDVADLVTGQSLTLIPNILGYEWDMDVDNGYRPEGMINLSLSTVAVQTYLYDYGTTVAPGTATHSLTLYRAESGALVFGAGTVYWSWGLDSHHAPSEGEPADANVQQAMVNLFADMGVLPGTLQASLVMASASTDHTAPTTTIGSIGSSTIISGEIATITGTAADVGGIVAGVEVSTDNGQTWHKAAGRETWSYSWYVQGNPGTYQIQARAVDDSVNIGAATAAQAVTVTSGGRSSLFGFEEKPDTMLVMDNDEVELGVKFTTSADGTILGMRFYKPAQIEGERVAHLWSSTGVLLATATFTAMSWEGWQTVHFDTPVAITPGQTYIASFHTKKYAASEDYFTTPKTSGPLTAPTGAAVFAYGANGIFPSQNGGNANYFVDVIFAPSSQEPPIAMPDNAGSTKIGAPLTIAAASLLTNDSDPNGDPLTLTQVGGASHGSVVLSQDKTQITFTPTAGYTGAASFTYTISDGQGGTATATATLQVLPEDALPVSFFPAGATPAVASEDDNSSVELGMKFQVSSAGTITGIRFYKGVGNTGTHTGTLWSSSGQALATVTFGGESASGWQTATFSTPIAVTPGQVYTASYHTTTGHYSDTGNYFTAAVTNGPITTPVNAGVFAYGSSSAFPTQSFNAANYFVDVVFQPQSQSAPVAMNDPGPTVTLNTPVTIATSTLLQNDSDPNGDPLSVTAVGGNSHGTAVLNQQGTSITFTPQSGYTGQASFTYTISDGNGGSATATVSMSVVASSQAPVNLFAPSATPAVASENDTGSVELGMKFVASTDGTVTGIRFYKGDGNSGTHTGTLWSSSGQALATVTFVGESASGWQSATFSTPIAVTAGQTYTASYHTSTGHYSDTTSYFTAPVTNGPLTAPINAGVYAYGGSTLYPTQSFNATNYWIDVDFQPLSQSAPVAVADNGPTVTQNTPITFATSTLLQNDSDPNGDTLTVTAVSGASHGSVALDAQGTSVTFTPEAGYTGAAAFSYTISDGHGGAASANVALSIVPSGLAPTSLFAASATPAVASENDTSSVELGVKFTSSVAGTVSAIKFFKGDGNTGTHTGTIWSSTGTALATATFSNETATGWQTATFSTPVTVTPGQTYTASYHAPNGHYADTGSYFANAMASGPLTTQANAGVYAYGGSSLMPTSSYQSTNYWVDVVFNPQA